RGGTYLRWRLRLYLCSYSDDAAAHFLTRLGLFRFRQPIRNNLHHSSERQLGIKLGNVFRFHANAAVTCGTTDLVFLRRAMNTNEALKRRAVLRLKSSQPDDALCDGIAAGSFGLKNLPR